MKEIKYRVITKDRTYYWGFINDSFISPPFGDGYSISEIKELSAEFTSLKDKNGKEIYEGDIAKYAETCIGGYNDMVGVVTYLECSWWIDDKKRSFANPLFSETAILEVIGNTHENPELLQP